jgi:tripartite motif-containing protein 71
VPGKLKMLMMLLIMIIMSITYFRVLPGADGYHKVLSIPKSSSSDGSWILLQTGPCCTLPQGITVDDQRNIYIADVDQPAQDGHRTSGRIFRVSRLDGSVVLIAQSGDEAGRVRNPHALAVDGIGLLYLADTGNHRVQKLSPAGQALAVWGPVGGPSPIRGPRGIALDADGNVYVTDTENSRLLKFSPSGGLLAEWGRRGDAPGEFYSPTGVAVDSDGTIYVSDSGLPRWEGGRSARLQKLSPSGSPIAHVWLPLTDDSSPIVPTTGVVVSREYGAFVTFAGFPYLLQFDRDLRVLARWGEYGTGPGRFRQPSGVALDPTGGILVTDSASANVHLLTLGPK